MESWSPGVSLKSWGDFLILGAPTFCKDQKEAPKRYKKWHVARPRIELFTGTAPSGSQLEALDSGQTSQGPSHAIGGRDAGNGKWLMIQEKQSPSWFGEMAHDPKKSNPQYLVWGNGS